MAMNKSDIVSQFQSALGRDPTAAEIQYFMKQGQGFGGAGMMSPYEVGQYAASTPEGQLRSLGRYTDLYSSKLGQSDDYMMGLAQNRLMGQFRQMGRPSSSGYIAAFANAAQSLAANRQAQVAQFYGQGLGNAVNTQYEIGQNALQWNQQLAENEREYDRSKTLAMLNYDKQMDFYNTQRRQGMQSGLINAGLGVATLGIGAGIGAALGPGSGIGKYPSMMGPSWNG